MLFSFRVVEFIRLLVETSILTNHNNILTIDSCNKRLQLSGTKAANAINAAREAYFIDTCILFYPKPANYSGDYIEIFSGRGCYSSLGRIGRGKQQVEFFLQFANNNYIL